MIHRNQYNNPLDRNGLRPGAPNFSINDIHFNTRQQGSGRTDRDNKAALFQSWYDTQQAFGDYIPSWEDMRYDVNLRLKFCENIETYLHYVHRATLNSGDSLQPYLAAVIYVARLNGVNFGQGEFKWWKSFKLGCNEISRNVFHSPPKKQKRAIFNPMLEKMLEQVGSDWIVRFGVLFAHRFCARAQQYVNTKSDADILTYGSLHFDYVEEEKSNNNPFKRRVHSVTYRNSRDKNHKWGEHPMDRTVYCTCDTKWTCFPCYAEKIINYNRKYYNVKDDDAILVRDGALIEYRDWQKIVQSLMAEIDCDPDEYGSHSLRAGGASERDLMGDSPLEIQNFGFWKTLDSVFGYIRLNNPDMIKFVRTFDGYVKLRRKECKLSSEDIDSQNKSYLKLMSVSKQSFG